MGWIVTLLRHLFYPRESWDWSLMLFTETMLAVLAPDTSAGLDGFQLFCNNRTIESGMRKGGGLVNANTKAVYHSPLPTLGQADHNLAVTAKRWSDENEEAL